MALWQVDITLAIVQQDNSTAFQIIYGKTALADSDAGIWLDCSDADDQLDQWHVGRNYTCWFNPDEIQGYPFIDGDYSQYAWFEYEQPGNGGSINYFALGVTFLVFAGLTGGGVIALLSLIFCAMWSHHTEVATPINTSLLTHTNKGKSDPNHE
ncbi:hypothetical protein Pelo_17943 [Pelomyxa schiedti]|nr:hypothetical protein Pelo_17943 [Pelomyxa schiedti]